MRPKISVSPEATKEEHDAHGQSAATVSVTHGPTPIAGKAA